jgi:PhnB protein
VYINGGSVMMSDAYPEHGHPLREPAGFNVTLQVADVDAWYKRAIEAGCTAIMPPADMFWGERYGQLKDSFGIVWAINGPIKK